MNNLAEQTPGLSRIGGIFLQGTPLSVRAQATLRAMLFAYLSIVLCPIQYWPLAGDIDSTWIFALNYAHAHQLVIGREIFWTWGPLAHLALPMDIGANLAQGLAFQSTVWILALGILWDLFYRSGLPVRHLAFFSVFFGLSASVSGGADQVVLRCALILLVRYKMRQGISRYIAALVLLSLLPLIKFTWAMVSGGTIAGLLVYLFLSRQPGFWRNSLLAVTVPLCVAGTGYWLTLGSLQAFVTYLKASTELSTGFNLAMSSSGPSTELLAALEALFLLLIGLATVARWNRDTGMFFGFVLVVPLFISFKHGFVLQDAHIHHFFCFIAVVLGLFALTAPLNNQKIAVRFAILALVFALIWQDNVLRTGPDFALISTGLKTPLNFWNVLRHVYLRRTNPAGDQQALLRDEIVEDEIKLIVQHEPIASLSTTYTQVYASGMNLVLYPIIQRYSAYTPYLDQLNASWIRDHGPRFLIFDGKSNGRHPWMETPAMWLEVYRWYDTRLLATHNLLLERRVQPRFTDLEPIGHESLDFGDELTFSSPSQPIFWAMSCNLSKAGKLRALLFRVSEVTMRVETRDGHADVYRIAVAVVASPSPGAFMPSTLSEFGALFRDQAGKRAVEKLTFGGPGSRAYTPACSVEFSGPR